MLNNQMVIVALVSEGITELPGRGEAEHGHEAKRKQSTTGHNPCLFHDEMGMVQNLWYHPDFDPYPNLKNMLSLFQSGDPNIQSPSMSSFGNVLCFNHGSTVLQRKTSPLSLQGKVTARAEVHRNGGVLKKMLPTGEVTTGFVENWLFLHVGRDIP